MSSPATKHSLGQRLRRALSRRVFPFGVAPAGNIVEAANDSGHFECVGPNPTLRLYPRDGSYPHGWTRMRMRVSTVDADLSWKLYFDTGDGFREEDSRPVPVPFGRQGAIEFIQFLPPNLRALRLDPTEDSKGRFSISGIEIQEITKQEALLRTCREALGDKPLSPRRVVELGEQVLHGFRVGGIAQVVGALQAGRGYPPYEVWLRRFDTLSDTDRVAIGKRIDDIREPPLISIVMPAFETPELDLRRAIGSVQRQLYPRWELCIADDCSARPHVKSILDESARSDSRIKVSFRDANGHISAASNTALALAQGEFVALLDHDDELTEHALYMVAEELLAHPEAGVIYSDEDKIDDDGRRYDPYFKPDWNPDLLYSQNYVSHLGAYRRKLVESVGGFRVGFEGSQDLDLLLRCVEKLAAGQIRHVPHILYHWRSSRSSMARPGNVKSYAHVNGARALTEHFARRGESAAVLAISDVGRYRVRYSLPATPPLVSLIVPTRDRCDLLRACVESVLRLTRYPSFELVVVDNRSEEASTLEYLRSIAARSGVRVIRYDREFNYSAINNHAVSMATGAVVGLLNNDIEVRQGDWLEEMVAHALRPDIGAVGARLLYPNETVQHAGVILGIGGVAGHAHKHLSANQRGYFDRAHLSQDYSAVTAACLVVRKSVYEEVGGLDPALPVAFNDVDFCLRIAQRGYRNLWTPYAELVHHESASRGADASPERAARFAAEVRLMKERWGPLLLADPNYNPNLTLLPEDHAPPFAPAFPPRAVKPWESRLQATR